MQEASALPTKTARVRMGCGQWVAPTKGKAMSRAVHDALGWARDTVQSRIVAQLFAQRVQGIALKGGMAFRVTHPKHARATKDIDLDADQSLSLGTVQRVIRQAIGKATADGLLTGVVVTEPKQTDTTARWKVSGVYPRTGQALHLTVEISRRETIDADETLEVPFGPDGAEMVRVYTDRSLAFKKVKALLSDAREAPRDISDLFLLIQAHVEPPVPELRRWLAQGGLASVDALWKKMERLDKDAFRAEVLPSLPPTLDGQLLYDDWDAIRLEVGEHVARWLQLAETEGAAPAEAPAARSGGFRP